VRRLRLAASLCAVIGPGLLMGNWLAASASGVAAVAHPELPARVGEWIAAEDEELDAEVLAVIEPDAHVMRRYETEHGGAIWVYVGLYAGRAGYGRGAHDPEVCYPAQGWEIMESEPVSVALADGELAARRLIAQRDGRQESVIYWFQPAGRWPRIGAAEQLWRVGDAVGGRSQYAFVRLSAPVVRGKAPDLAAFARALAPDLRALVERMR
jgi:EpsI family protein